jgi:hypothetical protein
LRQQCLAAVQQWPWCETVREIGASFGNRGECCFLIIDYGVTSRVNQRVADRAVRSFQNEARRHFHLVDWITIEVSLVNVSNLAFGRVPAAILVREDVVNG